MMGILVLLLSMSWVLGQRNQSDRVKTHYKSNFQEWLEFKTTYGKVYADKDTEQKHYETFKSNLQYIMEHNKLYNLGKKSFYLDINSFADMTYIRRSRDVHLNQVVKRSSESSSFWRPRRPVSVPQDLDLRAKGYVTPVKNQGQCSSSWAFSATGAVEGFHFNKTGKLLSLSEQQLLDCSLFYGEVGCNGGDVTDAFAYIVETGLESEESYPYEEMTDTCRYDQTSVVAKIRGFDTIPITTESVLKTTVYMRGPVAVAIDASNPSFLLYKGGIYDEPRCSSTSLDHGALVVGYGTDRNGQDYWIVKNSWGTEWGDEGYIKMSRNKDNQCGIASHAIFLY